MFTYFLAGPRIKITGGMPGTRILFGRLVSLPFDCAQMKYTGTLHILDIRKNLYEFGDVISVERPEIADVQTLEYILMSGNERFQSIAEP